jgi:predicted transcriptional regulator
MRKLTAVRLDPQQLKALEKVGKREDRSVSWLIRKAIDEFLKHAQSGKKEIA